MVARATPSNAARRRRAWRRPWRRTPFCELSVWQTALDLRLFRLWRSAFSAWRPLPPSFCAHRLLAGPPFAQRLADPQDTDHTLDTHGSRGCAARRYRAWGRPWHRTPLCELSVWQTALDLRLFRP